MIVLIPYCTRTGHEESKGVGSQLDLTADGALVDDRTIRSLLSIGELVVT